MLRLLFIPALLIALLAGTMIWSGGPAQKKADFTFITRAEIHTLDPNRTSWVQDFRVAYALWEGLYRLDPATLEAIPGSASIIDISPDKTVFTFHLRPGARWSNNDEVLAKDFVFAWRRMLEEPGEYTYLLHYIKGAQEYEKAYGDCEQSFNKSQAVSSFAGADFSSVGLREIDPRTLRVTLIHPLVPFPDMLTMPPFFPLNERSMKPFLDRELFDKSEGRIRRYDKAFAKPPHLVGNGPYYLESWAYLRRMRMVANPYYWNRTEVHSPIVDQIVGEDPQWAYAMYASGGADWITDFVGVVPAELYKRGDKDIHVFPAYGTYFYSFNCNPKFNDGTLNPFADKRVRQALSMAIDKKDIVETITRLGEIPTTTYIPANSFKGYHTPQGLAYNVARAKQLLADAGYRDGKGFPDVKLLFDNVPPHPEIGENIARQWKDHLGIIIKLEGIEGATFANRERNHDYAVCRASWYGDYLDPSTFTDKYKPDSENNEAAWVNAEYAEYCRKGDNEPDPARRLGYYEQAEKLLLDEAPICPIYTYVECYAFRDNVYGIPLNARAMHVMSSVGVKH